MLERAKALQAEMVRLRRDIHQHPELSFQEVRTARLVADTLAEIGLYRHQNRCGSHGRGRPDRAGKRPHHRHPRDMDALPIHEQVDVPSNPIAMGDARLWSRFAHGAMLLGAAHLLAQSYAEEKEAWKGNVRLLFQPAEEAFDADGISGATAMIQDGALAGVDKVIALHVISTSEAGKLYFHDGPSLAAVDSFEAWVRGDGGHGAYPHEGSDPLYILSTILPRIYGIPSRRIDPLEPCVISLGEIRGGSAPNVIPTEIYVQGTIRSLSPAVRERLWAELESCFKLAESLGGSYEFRLHKGYPPLVNDAAVNDWMRRDARPSRRRGHRRRVVRHGRGGLRLHDPGRARAPCSTWGPRSKGRRPPYPRLRHRRSGHAHRRGGASRDSAALRDRRVRLRGKGLISDIGQAVMPTETEFLRRNSVSSPKRHSGAPNVPRKYDVKRS